MDRTKTYFLSDIHLGASYIRDTHAHQRRVVDFLRSIADDAKAVYLLGDILDYWYEYRTVVPRGYVRFFGQLARMADDGIRIIWFTGNHDIWLRDYLRDEIGIEVVDTPGAGIFRSIDGEEFFLGHGDFFGPQPAGYRFIRRLFRSRFCQALYSAIHPRWTIPFAHGWSSHSRKQGGGYQLFEEPSESEQRTFSGSPRTRVTEAAEALAKERPDLRYIIIGHHHVPADIPVGKNCRLVILGNWINRSDYAVYDAGTLTLKS